MLLITDLERRLERTRSEIARLQARKMARELRTLPTGRTAHQLRRAVRRYKSLERRKNNELKPF